MTPKERYREKQREIRQLRNIVDLIGISPWNEDDRDGSLCDSARRVNCEQPHDSGTEAP